MLRFVESFDHQNTNTARKWTSGQNHAVATPGYNGVTGSYMQIFDDNGNQITKVLDSQATWTVGFGFRWFLPGWDNEAMFALMDGSTFHPFIVFRPNTQTLDVRLGGSGAVLGTGTTLLKQGVWYYIEFQATIHDSTGAIELRINEQTEFSATNIDTRNGANASADRIRWGGIGGFGSGLYHLAEIYACDATGGVNDDFLGECKIAALLPDGNGNSSQFDGSDGNTTDNYLLVDESTPDDDTTYVESPDVGDKDTYAYEAMPNTGTVHGVQIIPCARKTDGAARQINTVARHSGSEVDSAAHTLTSSYAYYHDIRETKPGGGSWSVSDVNGAEFGYKVAA